MSVSSTADPPLILAIETSCDETAVAIARGTEQTLVSEISSQIAIHRATGGVVPEVASRNHNRDLRPLISHALNNAGVSIDDIDAIAATAGPGLASSLLIGNTTAKAIAVARRLPYYAINHLEGHLLSPFVGNLEGVQPCVALIVSGGHTSLIDVRAVGDYQLLGRTRDDAAGEAFDKVGKLLGLPYPGGPEIDSLSSDGDPAAFDFPRSMLDAISDNEKFTFSFSGLKTSVAYCLQKIPETERARHLPDLCASFQQAVVEVLVGKTLAAARHLGRELVTVSGGVSCNRQLRRDITAACESAGLKLHIADPSLSTDNAAMIAYAAAARMQAGCPSDTFDHDIDPNLAIG